jgi:hypothetical protein
LLEIKKSNVRIGRHRDFWTVAAGHATVNPEHIQPRAPVCLRNNI